MDSMANIGYSFVRLVEACASGKDNRTREKSLKTLSRTNFSAGRILSTCSLALLLPFPEFTLCPYQRTVECDENKTTTCETNNKCISSYRYSPPLPYSNIPLYYDYYYISVCSSHRTPQWPESRLNLFLYTTRMPFTVTRISEPVNRLRLHIVYFVRCAHTPHPECIHTESNNRLSNLLPKNRRHGVRSMCCAPVFMRAFYVHSSKKIRTRRWSGLLWIVWAEKWPCRAIV